jgi:hypothetical protein
MYITQVANCSLWLAASVVQSTPRKKKSRLLGAFTAKKTPYGSKDRDYNGIPSRLLRWFQTVSSDNGKAVNAIQVPVRGNSAWTTRKAID